MDFNSTFNENGHVKIPKNSEFAEFISDLATEVKSVLPDFESAEIPNKPHTLLDTAFQHRLDAFDLLPEQVVHKNPLFGKRIIIQAHDLPKKLIPLLEHPHILNHVSSILDTKDLILLNGSIHASYPGSSENDMQYHSDTANFSNTKKALQCVSENKFVVNVQVFLDDVDEKLAPTKILSGTHKCDTHLAINSLVSKRLGFPDNEINLLQSNWIYDELIEDFNLNPKLLVGERGGISLMNSSVLHAASANLSSRRVRRVAILNYARKVDYYFNRRYPLNKSRIFLEKTENSTSLYHYYKKSAQVLPHIIARVKKFSDKMIDLLMRNVNRIVKPYYSIMRLRRAFERNINKIIKVKREYLNIGAGPVWLHERFFVLDQCFNSDKTLGRTNFDLVKDLPLPFENDSLKGIYSSHCFEHLDEQELTSLIKEGHRTLIPGGTFRVVVPDLGRIFDAYDRRDASYADWLRKKQHLPGHTWFKDSWLRLNTRLFAGHVVDLFSDEELHSLYENNSRKEFINKIYMRAETSPNYLNVPNVHKSYWTPDRLIKKFEELGFKNCLSVQKGITRDKVFSNGVVFDNTLPGKSVIVEASK